MNQSKQAYDKDYYRSFKGVLTLTYSKQRQRSRSRGHPAPAYTKLELGDWLIKNKSFKELWKVWVASGYLTSLKPSVDRLDDSKGYSFENIQLVTVKHNVSKSHTDIKAGNLKTHHIKIIQYDKKGNELKRFHSIAEASRRVGTPPQNIQRVCDKSGTAAGFTWRSENAST